MSNLMQKYDSTVVLQCYRQQDIPMEYDNIRPSVTLYSFNRSLPNLVWLKCPQLCTNF